MLHILWIILKIILWILLGIIGLVLLLLLLVLFAPITYKIDAEYDGKAKVKAKIRFLIVSVTLRFEQEKKLLENVIRIAGFRVGGGKGKAEPVRDAEDAVEELADFAGDEEDDADAEPDIPAQEENDVKPEVPVQEESDVKSEISDSERVPQEDSAHEVFDLWNNEDSEDGGDDGEKEGFFTRLGILLKSLFEKLSLYTPDKLADRIGAKLEAIGEKKQELERKISRIRKFWSLSCTVRTRSYLKKYLLSILRHIAPRRVKGRIHYGFDEPYKTGQITGYLSLMPFVYQKGLSLEPDFYNKIMEGHLYMRGHIQLGYILRIALNLNIWRTVKAARKLVNK